MKVDKTIGNFVILFLVIVIISQVVLSLGVAPARKIVDFEPGAKLSFEFTLVNTENKEMDVAIYAENGLADRIVVDNNYLQFSSNEEEKKVSYSLTLPNSLEPGVTETKIVARELPKESSGDGVQIGATVAVVHQFHVFVPYPGKYATAELKIAETGSLDSVSFLIPVNSLGEQNIVSARGIIDIYGPTNEKIATLNTNELGIEPGKRVELVAIWDENVNPGRYLAKATVVYDGEITKEVENTFTVGGVDLNILEMKVNEDFRLLVSEASAIK